MLRRRAMLAPALALATLPGARAHAQAVPLPEGARAQITLTRHAADVRRWRADAARRRGSIEAETADSFRLRLRDGRACTCAWQELAVLERSRGRDRDHRASRGALVGGAIGGARVAPARVGLVVRPRAMGIAIAPGTR